MRIFSVQFKPQISKLDNLKRNFYYNFNSFDTVSFGSKSTVKSRILNLPEEFFPSNDLKEHILNGLNSDNSQNVLDLHCEYYVDLLDCKTLAEAKEKYPEFRDVKEASEINPEDFSLDRYYRKIKKGQVEGINFDNLSLEVLKLVYAQAISPNFASKNKLLGLGRKSAKTIVPALNIPYNKQYFDILAVQKTANATSELWKKPEHKKRISENAVESWKNEKRRQEASQRSAMRWQDEAYREDTSKKISIALQKAETKAKKSENMSRIWATEGEKERRIKAIKESWSNPELLERTSKERKGRSLNPDYLEKISRASKANWQNPEYRKKMAQAQEKRWEDPKQKQKAAEIMIERWRDPAYRQHMIDVRRKQWQEQDYIDLMSVVSYARSKAWQIHPSAREIYARVAKETPVLGVIISKIKKGIPLNSTETSIYKKYFKKCHSRYPNLLNEIGAIQKELLANWGFYSENRDLNELLDIVASESSDSIEDIL